ncbi:alpha/beta fold hydrolase [Nocardia pseudovaccinii]|uniref:alpha/beta fold hydrolase n=1 Tax=Nocardia pseudovaccinii TaxID=189540 RepID=UPI00157C2831|nr:alpha/beta hydrolase [Nocardia pseudovaccinii]
MRYSPMWRTGEFGDRARLPPAAAAALIPSARLVVIDEAGHMAHIDQPDQWLGAVREFLS